MMHTPQPPNSQYRAEQIALDLIARGFAPVPVPIGKQPTRKQWQTLRITGADVPKYFHGADINVGAIMGPPSGHLTDIDLDCIEALELAPFFLPDTQSVYGRPSKQRSHWLYSCKDPQPKASIKMLDEHSGCIVELRMGGGGKGAQSVMPGSIHPSGEIYQWNEDGARSEIPFADLNAAVVKIAVGTILIRNWPPLGVRNETAMALGGLLARTGWTPDAIEQFVTAICTVHGEATDPAAHGKSAKASANNLAAGGEVYGLPKLKELFGDLVMKKIAKHLGYNPKGVSPEPPPKKNNNLPIVKYGALSAMTDRAVEVLLAAEMPFYQRGNKLVRPVVLPVDTFGAKRTLTAQLVEIDLHYLRDALCRKSRWVRLDSRTQTWQDIHPVQDVAMVLLKRFGDWKFPIIAGIITTPTLRPDGSILSQPGYDPATKLLLIDPPPMPELPEHPSKDHALAALRLLKELLVEFPFVDDVSRSVALSAIISTVCRGAFPVVPMHVIDAPAASSGKSYLLSTVAWIATGQAMPVLGAGKSEEELEKRLGAAVIHGQPLVCIDNVVGELGGDALCRLIEQPRPSVRILGHSQNVEIDARAVTFFANGNNLIIVGDLYRRVVHCRLDPQQERPELRTFRSNPRDLILANRGNYIAACLIIARAYIAAGKPCPCPQLASFNEWSDVVRSALVWCGEADPVVSMDASKAEDPETSALTTMLTAWAKVFGTGPDRAVSLREVIERCEETGIGQEYEHPELRIAVVSIMPDHLRQHPDVNRLSYWLRSRRDRRAGGLWFTKRDSDHGPNSWWVEAASDQNAVVGVATTRTRF